MPRGGSSMFVVRFDSSLVLFRLCRKEGKSQRQGQTLRVTRGGRKATREAEKRTGLEGDSETFSVCQEPNFFNGCIFPSSLGKE